MVIARSLVQALRDAGHSADIIVTPQNRFGRQASAYVATWLTDVGSSDGQPIDQVISLRYPSYAVRHPNHVCWLNHTMREYYDLWPRFTSGLGRIGRDEGECAPRAHPARGPLPAHAERPAALRPVAHDSAAAGDVAGAASDRALPAATAATVSLRRVGRLRVHGLETHAAEARGSVRSMPFRAPKLPASGPSSLVRAANASVSNT